MARYRKIDPRIWNDEKFASLSHEAQRAFFFILTHPSMTSLGAFRISAAGMAQELGLTEKGFQEPFHELLSKGIVRYDEKSFLVFAPNFLKYNPPENPNVIKGWAVALDYLPECGLKHEVLLKAKQCASNTDKGLKAFVDAFGDICHIAPKGFQEPFPKGMPIKEQEQEQEQEIKVGGAFSEKVADAPEPPPSDFCDEIPEEPFPEDWGALEPLPPPETKPAKKEKRGTRLGLKELPEPWERWAEEKAPDLDPKAAFEEFRNYWIAVPGAKGVKLDWFATFRNSVLSMPDWKRKTFRKKTEADKVKPASFEEIQAIIRGEKQLRKDENNGQA